MGDPPDYGPRDPPAGDSSGWRAPQLAAERLFLDTLTLLRCLFRDISLGPILRRISVPVRTDRTAMQPLGLAQPGVQIYPTTRWTEEMRRWPPVYKKIIGLTSDL